MIRRWVRGPEVFRYDEFASARGLADRAQRAGRTLRVAGRDGRVEDLDLAELERLDVGAWYGDDFAGERVPTLDAFFEVLAAREEARALVELKADWSPDEVRRVVDLIEVHRLQGRVVLQSNSATALIEAVAAGMGITELVCRRAEAYPQLVRVLPNRRSMQDVWLVTHADLHKTARIRALMECIVEAFDALKKTAAP